MDVLCPVCKEKLIREDKRYHCLNDHSFDLSKEGYLNLNLKSSSRTGDEKEMIRARKAFLEKDHYLFLRKRLNEIIDELKPGTLLDLGCGEGYYTRSFNVPEKMGIDLSKEALKIASRTDKSTLYVLKSIFDLPVKDESIDLMTTIFAPVSKDIERVLKKDGYFILVRPDNRHLLELKEAVYDEAYLNDIEEVRIEGLRLIKEERISSSALLSNEELRDLFKMTPYYHKTSPKDMAKLEDIESLKISFCFLIDVYRKTTCCTM